MGIVEELMEIWPNEVCDNSLSRRPNWKVGVERDNENQTPIKSEWLETRRMEMVEIIVEEANLLKKVKQSKVKNNKVVKAVEEMKW